METLLEKKAKRASIVDGASIEDLLNASSDNSVKINIDNTRDAVIITDNEFKLLIKEISPIEDSNDILEFIDEKKSTFLFSSNQLLDILSSITSVKTRLQIIIKLAPRLTNPTVKLEELVNMFRFAEDRSKVEEVLKARAKVTGVTSTKSTLGGKGSALAMGKGGSALAMGRSTKAPLSTEKKSTQISTQTVVKEKAAPEAPAVNLDDFVKDPEEERKINEDIAIIASALSLSSDDVNDIKKEPLEKWELKAIAVSQLEEKVTVPETQPDTVIDEQPKRRFSAWLQQAENNSEENIEIQVPDTWREDVRKSLTSSLFNTIEASTIADQENSQQDASVEKTATTTTLKKRRSTHLAPQQDSNIHDPENSLPAFLSLSHEEPIGTSSTGRPYFSYQELVRRNYHKNYFDLNPLELELYLCNEDFMSKFGMTKDQFKALPKWRQTAKKRSLLLF